MKLLEKILLGLTISSALATGLLAFALVSPSGFMALFYTLAHVLPFMVNSIASTYQFLFTYAPVLIFLTALSTLGSGLLTFIVSDERKFQESNSAFHVPNHGISSSRPSHNHSTRPTPVYTAPPLFTAPPAPAHYLRPTAAPESIRARHINQDEVASVTHVARSPQGIQQGIAISDFIAKPPAAQVGYPIQLQDHRQQATTESAPRSAPTNVYNIRPVVQQASAASEPHNAIRRTTQDHAAAARAQHEAIRRTAQDHRAAARAQHEVMRGITQDCLASARGQHQTPTRTTSASYQPAANCTSTASAAAQNPSLSYFERRRALAQTNAQQIITSIDLSSTGSHTNVGANFLAALKR